MMTRRTAFRLLIFPLSEIAVPSPVLLQSASRLSIIQAISFFLSLATACSSTDTVFIVRRDNNLSEYLLHPPLRVLVEHGKHEEQTYERIKDYPTLPNKYQ